MANDERDNLEHNDIDNSSQTVPEIRGGNPAPEAAASSATRVGASSDPRLSAVTRPVVSARDTRSHSRIPASKAPAVTQVVSGDALNRSAAQALGTAPKKSSATRYAIPAAVIVLIVVLILVAAPAMYNLMFPTENPNKVLEGEVVMLTVPEGSTSSQIGQLLKDAGVIATTDEFNKEVSQRDVASQMKAGTYRFTGGEDVGGIIDTLISGKTGYTVTIPEGLTAKKIAKIMHKKCEVKEKAFYNLTLKAKDYQDDYPFLEGVYNNSMEGFLFPDTYNIAYGATADDIIRVMLDNFQAKLAGVDMSYASKKNLTVFDVITLASVVEKESATKKDMKKVASVFYNRLHLGMNLGSDVTTYYAVGKELTEDLTDEDLNSDSPYNTRNPDVKGLPAGPICNPGLAAIKASAHPKETDYVYFFYSNSQQKTYFFKDSTSFQSAWALYGD